MFVSLCMCLIALLASQFQALASALYSSGMQDSALMALGGNYRKPQRLDDRVILVSFQDGEYGLPVTACEQSTTPPLQSFLIIKPAAGLAATICVELVREWRVFREESYIESGSYSVTIIQIIITMKVKFLKIKNSQAHE